jgi:anti-anti-sigma factor
MNITREKSGDYSILTLNGRIDTTTSPAFEGEIEKLFGEGEKKLIFDCSGLNYISSSGLRVFLIAQKKVILLRGTLSLCAMQPAIREIFVISGFATIFKIYETREEALVQ